VKICGNQWLFQVGNQEREENYDARESVNIEWSFYDHSFKGMFKRDFEKNYHQSKSFLNFINYLKGKEIKIEWVELVMENYT
jgi:hypothetical protein